MDSPGQVAHSYGSEGCAACKAGLPPRTPRRMGCRPRCFNPSLPTRHAAGSSLHQRGETPHPRGRAISVPLAPVTSGSPRSPPGTSPGRSGRIEARIVQLPKLTAPLPSAGRRLGRSHAHRNHAVRSSRLRSGGGGKRVRLPVPEPGLRRYGSRRLPGCLPRELGSSGATASLSLTFGGAGAHGLICWTTSL